MPDLIVDASHEDGVATITIDRPKALNALNASVIEALTGAVYEAAEDPTVRVIVLKGGGERAFVAGADIAEFVGATVADALDIAARLKRLTDVLVTARQPVVAAIRGYCLGGGLELALACDIRIAAEDARFGLPEIGLGILPGGGGTVRLTKLVGSSVARMLAMTGEPIDAARAYALGLLRSVHEVQALEAATADLAMRLARLPPFALGQLKSVLNAAVDAPAEVGFQAEAKAFALCYTTEDQKEGASAFLEKRKPVFTGR